MLELRNEINELTLKLTASGFTNEEEEWLELQLQVSQSGNTFSRRGSYLEAADIWHLADWLRALLNHQAPYEANLYFLKPNVSFHHIDSSMEEVIIAVGLHAEFEVDFMLHQSLSDSFSESMHRLVEIIKRGGRDPYDYKNHLYFAIKWQEFPGIIHKLKEAGRKHPPYRNMDMSWLKGDDDEEFVEEVK